MSKKTKTLDFPTKPVNLENKSGTYYLQAIYSYYSIPKMTMSSKKIIIKNFKYENSYSKLRFTT
jgi:hypothetical protein